MFVGICRRDIVDRNRSFSGYDSFLGENFVRGSEDIVPALLSAELGFAKVYPEIGLWCELNSSRSMRPERLMTSS
jgi:hypothetical protein